MRDGPSRGPTFWEQPAIAIDHVSAQEPAIVKLIVPLNQLDAVALD